MSDLLKNSGNLASAAVALRDEDFALLPELRVDARLTLDQWEWIEAAEEDYRLVRESLLLYFSGREPVYQKKISDNRWLVNWVKYYRLLYSLIYDCWEPLKASRFFSAKEQLKFQEDMQPGKLLSFLLRCQFLALANECFLPYCEFCVSKQREFLKSLDGTLSLSPARAQTLKVTKRQFLRDYGNFYLPLMATLKTINRQSRKSGKGSQLSRDLAQLLCHVNVMRESSLKRLRSRKPSHWKSGIFHVGR